MRVPFQASPAYRPLLVSRPGDMAAPRSFQSYDDLLGARLDTPMLAPYGRMPTPLLLPPRDISCPVLPDNDPKPPVAPAGRMPAKPADTGPNAPKPKSESKGDREKKDAHAKKAGPGGAPDVAPDQDKKKGGKGGPGGKGGKAAQAGMGEEKKEQPPPPLAPLSPKTGGHHLARAGFHVRKPDGSFDQKRELDVKPLAKPPEEGGKGEASLAPVPDFKSLYAVAVDESFGLYRRLMHEAETIVADAERRDRELATFHQAQMMAALQQLDTALDINRTMLAARSEQLKLTVETDANQLRRRIYGAAGAAIAAFDKLVQGYADRLGPLREQRTKIVGDAGAGTAAVKKAGDDAAKKLTDFAKDAASFIPAMDQGPVQDAVREAQLTYVPGYAQADKEGIEKTRDALGDYLKASFKCLDCDFDHAFQGMDAQLSATRDSGHKSIGAARDGALKGVDQAVESLGKAIDANRETTERILVTQHQRTRDSLIESAQSSADREAEQLADSAQKQSEALASMAAGQPHAVEQTHEILASQAIGPPAQFGQMVARATARLRLNIAGIAGRQPKSTSDAAQRLAAGQQERARQFEARQRLIIRGVDLGLGQTTDQSVYQLDRQIFDTMASMDHLPGDVAKAGKSLMEPTGKALKKCVQGLTDSVGSLAAKVDQVLNGGNAMAEHADKVKARKEAEAKADPKAAQEEKEQADKADKEGDKGAKQPEPASCGDCKDEGKKEEKPKDPAPKPDGAKGSQGGAKNDAKAPEEGEDSNTPKGFRDHCAKIVADPKIAPQIAGFLKRANTDVNKELSARVGQLNTALSTTFAPDKDAVMASLRGLTILQGKAIKHLYGEMNPGGMSLEKKIRKKFEQDSVWSAHSTDVANADAAINMLNGNAVEGAMSELIAAFNYSNENQRIRDVLLHLTPAQLADLEKNHGKELDDLATQLDGEDAVIFAALRKGNTGPAKAGKLLSDIDKINEEQRGQKRGDSIQAKMREASNDFHDALDQDPNSKAADIFHFEAQTDAVKKRNEGKWAALQVAFSELEPVKAAVDQKGVCLDPKEIMTRYATRTIRHEDTVGYGEDAYTEITYDTVNDYHTEWIRQTLRDGADSVNAKAARLLVEEQRDKPDLEGLNAAIHSDKGDAREGGGYDAKERQKGKEEAEKERQAILEASEKFRAKIQKTDPQTPEQAKERLKKSFAGKFANDELGQKVAAGMIDKNEGDPAAVMNYAIKHEKKDLALMQLRRMDRAEIEDFVEKYNKDPANLGGGDLYRKMGVFEHFGKSGTVFDGDEANDLSIAFMGVPQNDKERGEVALKVMTQTIDQSGAGGRTLANSEFKALVENARRLKEQMGVTDAAIDSHGRIMMFDRYGQKVHANFDAKGNFVPAMGGDITPFETAVAMSKIYSTAYTQATDRIANFITTALMVVAAVLTTVLTGGAAASIWIPVLVTAGAGLIGMALTATIKGGRYTRDEMLRDLVMTVVQAATAGIGAAVGAGLRGGAGAAKALASSMRMSEQALAAAAGQQAMLRGLTLAEEMAIGAGSNAISGAVGAAVDPTARRSDDYGMGIFHGFLRGAIGGAAGAAATRGVTAGIGSLAKGIGAKSGVNAVLNRGGSMELALRVGSMRARALSTSFLTEVGTRTLASGISGVVTRAADLGYNAAALNQPVTAAQFFDEVGWAFVQNAIQGFAEGAALRGMRAVSPREAAEHAFTTQGQDQDFREAALGALIKEGRRRGLIPPAPPTPPVPKAAPVSESAAAPPEHQVKPPHEEVKAAHPAGKPDADTPPRTIAAVDEKGAIVPMPSHHDDEAAQLGKLLTPAPGEHEPGAGSGSKQGTGEELLSAHSLDHDTPPGKAGANDNAPVGGDPVLATMDLSKTDTKTMARLPEGSVLIHPDSTDVMAANDNFGRMILADPTREVSHLYNPVTGESVVVQGGRTAVGVINAEGKLSKPGEGGLHYAWQKLLADKKNGHWILRSHYHPNHDGTGEAPLKIQIPTGAGADFGVVINEARAHGYEKRSSRIYYIDEGKLQFTDFGLDLSGKSAKYWISVPDKASGEHVTRPFSTMEEFHGFASGVLGSKHSLPPGFTEPDIGSITAPKRALESGSTAQKMSVADVADIHNLHAKVTAGDSQEALAMVQRMGLVGEAESMARLGLALNARALPLEVRQSLADTVFEATRLHMTNTGELGEGDKLHLFFHGALEERTASLKKGGINLDLVKGGGGDDFGKALYLSSGKAEGNDLSGLANAELYSGRDVIRNGERIPGRKGAKGEVFPFMVLESQLGRVVDVAVGGKHRADWEAFLDATPRTYPSGAFGPWKTTRDFLLRGGAEHRGNAFDAFLESAAFVAKHGEAMSKPDVVVGTLGEPGLTGGTGRGEQEALRVNAKELQDLLNKQIGFPKKTGTNEPQAPEPAPEARMLDAHSLDHPETPVVAPKPDETVAPKPKPDTAETDPAKPKPVDTEEIDAAAKAVSTAKSPAAEEDFDPFADQRAPETDAMADFHAGLDEHMASEPMARPAPQTASDALIDATMAQRKAWYDQALAHLRTQYPQDAAAIDLMLKMPFLLREAAIRAMRVDDEGIRDHALALFEWRLDYVHGPGTITNKDDLRRLIDFCNHAGTRYRASLRHVVEQELWQGRLASLPVGVRDMATHSSLVTYLAANHPTLLQTFHTDFMALAHLQPAQRTPAMFEEYVANQLRGHPVEQAETVGRRIVRFTSEADFHEAAAAATPNTRYEFGKLAYTTDGLGRVMLAEGVPVRTHGARGNAALQAQIGHSAGIATDVGFHLIAHIFGAVVNELTVVPGNGHRITGDPEPNLNGSAYKVEFENIVRNILDTTPQIVEVQVRSVYNSGNTTNRPDVFEVRFRTDAGRWVTARFINKF